MIVETWIEMLKEKLEPISPLLRLDTSVDAFLGAWKSSVGMAIRLVVWVTRGFPT
jgi:hypothetical protein